MKNNTIYGTEFVVYNTNIILDYYYCINILFLLTIFLLHFLSLTLIINDTALSVGYIPQTSLPGIKTSFKRKIISRVARSMQDLDKDKGLSTLGKNTPIKFPLSFLTYMMCQHRYMYDGSVIKNFKYFSVLIITGYFKCTLMIRR